MTTGGEDLRDLLTVLAASFLTTQLPRLEKEARFAAVRLLLRRLAESPAAGRPDLALPLPLLGRPGSARVE